MAACEDYMMGFEQRLSYIESKLFQTLGQNEELVKKVDSLEEVILSKEEQITDLARHAKNQEDNMKTLKMMFKDVLDESENLAFSVSLLEQKERDDLENIRILQEGIHTANIAFYNRNREIDLNILKMENEMMSEFSTTDDKFENVSKEAKLNEMVCTQKNQETMERLLKVEIENKKILEYMDELLVTTVTLIKKTKEDGSNTTKSETEDQNTIQTKIRKDKTLGNEPNSYKCSGLQTLYNKHHLPGPAPSSLSVSSSMFFPNSTSEQTAQHYGTANESYVYYPWSHSE